MKHRILFLQGVNDDGKATVIINKHGKLQLVLDGGCNTCSFLRANNWEVKVELLVPGDQRDAHQLDRPTVIFNEISDPDSHSIVLKRATEIRQSVSEIPCINEPAAIERSSREKVSQHLADISGIVAPKTIRTSLDHSHEVTAVWDEQFDGPIIVRKAGTHGGVVTALLRTRGDLSELDPIALDGSHFYISEFIDFRSADSLYRKYRLAMVNGRPFLRHVIISDHWLIHSSSRSYMNQKPKLQAEETSRLQSFGDDLKPKIEERCGLISDRIGLDYFGIDCGFMDDDQMIVFEANANMNVLINNQPKPNIWEPKIQLISDALGELISSKIHP